MSILMAGLALYIGVMPVVIGLAIWRGGPDERRGGLAILAGIVATLFAPIFGTNHWHGTQIPVMTIDAILFVALLAIVHRSRKFWPIWAAAAQLIGTLGHLAPAIFPKILAKIYIATQTFWVTPLLAALLIGTIGVMRERRRQSAPST
jgi:cytochrome bd-type quinol oxidase subunit 2